MKKYEVEESFIKEAYNSACPDWKAKIKDKFPDVFKSELEVGKWYKVKDGTDIWLFYATEINSEKRKGCGVFLTDNQWDDDMNFFFCYDGCRTFTLATEQEVKEALIKEAEKRGYKDGVECLFGTAQERRKISSNTFSYDFKDNDLCLGSDIIFKEGKWAEIIKETTVTQSELENFYKEAKGIDNLKIV